MRLPNELPRRGDLYNQRCPSRDISKHISNLWGLTILRLLRDNSTMRFSSLKKAIEGISDRMLSQTLRNLERDGLLRRRDYQLVPPKVDYSLTKLGNECVDRLIPFCQFMEDRMNVIVLNQMKYDKAPTVAEWQGGKIK
jgi:DNA-binding HxlR family transcriptional regulator